MPFHQMKLDKIEKREREKERHSTVVAVVGYMETRREENLLS